MEVRCDGVAENLPTYLYGDLVGEELREVEGHLQSCQSCAERLREFGAVRKMLEETPVPPMPDSGDIAAQVMARAHARRRSRPRWVPLAQAALVLIGIGLGIGLMGILVPGPGEIPVSELEALVEMAGEIPAVAMSIERQASRKYGLEERPIEKYVDPLAQKLNETEIVAVDQHYRTLRDLASGESIMLAAYFQYRLGDFYERRAKDPVLARSSYLKVFDFVSEGKVHDLAKSRIDNLLLAEPEK